MRVWIGLALAVLSLQIAVCDRANAITPVGECSRQQLLGYPAKPDEVQAHRTFPLPFISYPFNTKREQWGMVLQLRIDESGRIVCYNAQEEFNREVEINEERRALLQSISSQRYRPFTRGGKAVTAIVTETINEREAPQLHVPLPEVPPDQVQVSLERTGCYGTCPSYRVTVRGDGRATYFGDGFVDVTGKHDYQVPREDVAQLVQLIRDSDIWSLRKAYQSSITDQSTQTLTIKMGRETRTLVDYAGELAGMPSTVEDLERAVDKAARALEWTQLSSLSIEHLAAEHYDFKSRASADMLARAVANADGHEEAAIVQLIKLGAPIDGGRTGNRWGPGSEESAIELALRNPLEHVANELIARGALRTADRADTKKINSAFRAAIAGGRLTLVQKIWDQDNHHRPSLTFDDVSDDEPARKKKSDVILLLSHHSYEPGPWDGLEIAKWLVANGSKLKSKATNGTTLLHIAAESGDADFVRYLLAQGIDPSTPGEYGLPALGGAQDEDVALALLEAGTDLTKLNEDAPKFRDYAEYNHWGRVIEWLQEHGH